MLTDHSSFRLWNCLTEPINLDKLVELGLRGNVHYQFCNNKDTLCSYVRIDNSDECILYLPIRELVFDLFKSTIASPRDLEIIAGITEQSPVRFGVSREDCLIGCSEIG